MSKSKSEHDNFYQVVSGNNFPDMFDDNNSKYLISGKQRKKMKKDLSELKRLLDTFWYFENLERDHGGGMDDATCYKIIQNYKDRIAHLESELSKPSLQVLREEKLNELGI